MRVAIFCLLLSAVAISADLQSDIDEVAGHLPLEQLQQLSLKYLAAFPSLRPLIFQLQSIPDEQIYETYVNKDVVEYLNRREIDGKSVFLQLIRFSKAFDHELLQLTPLEEADSELPLTVADSLAEVGRLIASSGFFEVVHKKMESSPEFAKFIAVVQEPEFRAFFFRGLNPKVPSDRISARGWFSKKWKQIKKHGFGVGVSIPFGK